jgi:hypothetical protein
MFIKPPNIMSSNKIKAIFTTKTPVSRHIEEILAKEFNISKQNIYFPIQRHTNKIHVLESNLKPVVADAVLTERRGVFIGIQVADCVPILLYDKKKSVVGAVHAGWKGTAGQILKNTIKTMQDRFNSSTEDILIAMGPSIRQCCYEVGEDVKTAIQDVTGDGQYYHRHGDKFFIDLSLVNKIQALSIGIPPQNIWYSEEYTYCKPERFYSYRYSKGTYGRQIGLIGMW